MNPLNFLKNTWLCRWWYMILSERDMICTRILSLTSFQKYQLIFLPFFFYPKLSLFSFFLLLFKFTFFLMYIFLIHYQFAIPFIYLHFTSIHNFLNKLFSIRSSRRTRSSSPTASCVRSASASIRPQRSSTTAVRRIAWLYSTDRKFQYEQLGILQKEKR